jgi:branched-chain amino acid transport system substrate-binding protein
VKRYAFIVVSVVCIMGIMSIGASPAAAVKIGIVLPLTGAEAKFGEIEKRSFEMAVDEINKQGGIKGEKIELIVEDDTGRPEVGRSVAEKLINKDKVVMLGGGYSSSVTYAVAGVAQQNRIPFLVNTGSADKITTSGWDYVFRLNPPVSEYAGAIESLLTEVVKPQTVVILHENSLFGTSGAKSFEETCTKLGYQVLLKQGYEAGGIDFKPVLVSVKKFNPDVIYMVSYIMDASLLMKQAKELKLTPKMFIGGAAGFTMPEFRKNAADASEKVISATLWYQSLNYPGAMQYFKN